MADVTNTTRQAQTTRLSITASGLDGRLVERPLGALTLQAGETRTVTVRVGELPIQSTNSVVSVSLQIELTRPSGPIYVPTVPLYYIFGAGHADATFYRQEDVAQVGAASGRIATNLMDVRGRVLDAAAGRMIDVAGAGAVRGSGWQQGLTTIDAEPPGKGEPPVDASASRNGRVAALAAVVQSGQ